MHRNGRIGHDKHSRFRLRNAPAYEAGPCDCGVAMTNPHLKALAFFSGLGDQIAGMVLGVDIASHQDRTAYWSLPAPKKLTKNRDKIKAARKQNRNRK